MAACPSLTLLLLIFILDLLNLGQGCNYRVKHEMVYTCLVYIYIWFMNLQMEGHLNY